MTTRTALVVIGLIQQRGQILLVQQRGPTDPAPYWVAPGGLVETGESLSEALTREVAEECGLDVQQIGALAYCTQIDHPARAAQTLAFAFPILGWSGTPASRDPDGDVLDARWVAQDEAIARLAAVGWRGMREPLVAYLGGSAPAGTIWQYREVDGEQRLLTRLPNPPHTDTRSP